jgi:hypothetical protein
VRLRRAEHANPELAVDSRSKPAAAARSETAERPLPPRRVIREAMRISRSPGPEGSEHLLEAREIRRLEALYPEIDPKVAGRIDDLLGGFSGPGAPVARSLLLRAVLARMTKLIGAPPDNAETILGVLERFSKKMTGLSGEELLQRASVLDLDSKHHVKHRDPLALWARQGVIHARGSNDQSSDDEGLIQRFDASCGPTVIEMLVAQADPVFAFEIWESGLMSQSSRDTAAKFQKKLLEQFGGIAIGLREAEIRARTRNGLARLEADRHLDPKDGEALRAFLDKRGKLTRGASRALEIMRARFGFPTNADVKALRRQKIPETDVGLGYPELAAALAEYVSPLTGVHYQQTSPADGFARGQAWRHLDAVARALKSGLNVPFGLSEPDHWMLMTAVKGKAPNRSFLVSDPLGGRTDWVKEKDVVSGVFADKQFHLCSPSQRGYIDSFYLPEVRPQVIPRKGSRLS